MLACLSGCATKPPVAEMVLEASAPEVAHSRLWGENGERWLPGGRLPDFSYAGYRSGERPIPDYLPTISVAAYGARGDDEVDDTAAFQRALAAAVSGAVLVPPGRYIISDVLRITKSGVVLRGAGEGQSILYFPKPLEAIAPNPGATTGGLPTSNYSWSGGMVRLEGRINSVPLTFITAPAKRGDQAIVVAKPQMLAVGQWIEVFMTDTADNTLAAELYSGDAGDVSMLKGSSRASWVTRITKIDGTRVELERRLRFDVRPEWRPVVRSFRPTVEDSGVEDLTFEFPVTPYGGHFTEQGFNPLAFEGVANCWARRVKFVNPDSGPMVGGVFNTVSDAVFESQRPPDREGNQGHHGIYLHGGGDHLFTRFDFRMKFVHDISVSEAAGMVVSQGKGVDLCFDHHKRAPYEILFTDIDLGLGTRPWKSGGGAGLGKHAGARVTFWNLRAAGPLPPPPKEFSPWSINLVGVDVGLPPVLDGAGTWREIMPTRELQPADLYQAQLAVRLSHEHN
ncbi:MAG TPA: glycosyl hydrolase family 28-related protein [Rariglobus sp.]|nr:glycosyl hydrolase family 28-related protein [Rariglobus sp.]